MPELRRDPVVGYWTIISTERSRRPIEQKTKTEIHEAECPFCTGHESQTTAAVDIIKKSSSEPWDVRVVSSRVPILSENNAPDAYGIGLYDVMEGSGKHEIIIESSKHYHGLDEMPVAEIQNAVHMYAKRINELEKNPDFSYPLLFKNHGLISGSGENVIRHTRSQLIAMPIVPKRVREELQSTKAYYDRHNRCVFCDVLRQELGDNTRIVAQNKNFFAFCPFASRSPFEIWIMPKKHSPDFAKINEESSLEFAEILKDCLCRLKSLLDDPPYNFVLHTAPYRNHKKTVFWKTIEDDYHWYFQITPRLTHSAGFEWGTGIHINPTPPEDAATLLRETSLSCHS